MMKSLFTFLITIACALLVVVLVWPRAADSFAHTIIGQYTQHVSQTIKGDTVAQNVVEKTNISSIVSYFSINKNGRSRSLTADHIIQATNEERIAAGLVPLITNEQLNASAHTKADDMIARQYFEHISPDGKGVSDLGAQVGYDYIIMGENLALGDFNTTKDLLDAWMNSAGHRANILNKDYSDIGVAVVQGEYNGKTTWFAVQHFGTPRSVCPAINTDLKKTIDSINTDLKRREAAITKSRTAIDSPDHPNGEAYKAMITQFNELVSQYNALLVVSQEEIGRYNKQVAAFNTCLAGYQKNTLPGE